LISGRPEYRVDLLATGHSSFTNVCDIRDAYVAGTAATSHPGYADRHDLPVELLV
jgi:hypothetical protein